ncbi:glycosyl hydrolase 108 family protein, partial [Ferrovibrio sp.]|uniref:glycoside hydrolase family 108 protein n=1 Tax=Ferrovibrio sp. TaxID=1917215 RepID=UPI0035B2EAEE
HREGLLDADKTDGPTGFLGIYDHEAIEKFQKENGLKQDGWMGPGGESIKTFEKIYQPASIRPQPQQKPQLGWKDYSLNLFDPKTWAIWDRMDERERAFYAQQAAPQGQQENTLPATKARNTQNREQPIQTPSTSKAWLEKQEADRRFEDAHKMTRKIEGGYSNRAEDRGGETNFGITASTLNDFHRLYKDSDIPKSVEQLQPNQAEYILRRMYYDWNRVGEISDPSLARHIYDMSVNPNPQKAARWVQQGINELNGNDALKVDGRLGPITLNALNRLNENQIKTLNHNLSQTREKFYRALAEQDSSQNANLNGWVARAQAYR